MNPNFDEDQQRQLQLAPMQPAPSSGGIMTYLKTHKVVALIVVIIIIALIWYFCFKKKSSEVTINSAIPSISNANAARMRTTTISRANNGMY
jgi:hypothetical protein